MNKSEKPKPLRIIINDIDPETKAGLERVKTIYRYSNFAEALKHVMDIYTAYEKAKPKE